MPGFSLGSSHSSHSSHFLRSPVPAERSEFWHPDCTLLFTWLSYYWSGLAPDEVDEAVTALLALGSTAQRENYRLWFAASAPGPKLGETAAAGIDSADKIDPENAAQRALLADVFSHSMPVVDFWLAHVVLPRETVQYPLRLAASAAHLAPSAGGCAAGFSGTNDGHRLLPLFAAQSPLPDPALAATNGRMLGMLMEHAAYEPLPAHPSAPPQPPWRALLSYAVRRDAIALVDAGALLAGVAPSDAADAVLALLQEPARACTLRAVVFHDSGGWALRDVSGRRWPLRSSPVPERDAFVIFDEVCTFWVGLSRNALRRRLTTRRAPLPGSPAPGALPGCRHAARRRRGDGDPWTPDGQGEADAGLRPVAPPR